ncbi:MAG: hypothetical protein IJR25_02730 [Bacteroidales bacterium]|nr:hypothetical protein [Bacteroidales bacterium]
MKWLRNLLKGTTLSTALFVFQACYGMPQSALYESGMAPMDFSLVERNSGRPLEGITISVAGGEWNETQLGITGADGRCHVEIPYIRNDFGPKLSFQDPTGVYVTKDSTFVDLRERVILIELDSAR